MRSAQAELEASSELGSEVSPYKGLEYYRETDEDRFAGRDTEIFELISRITTSRALVFYGRSGFGKTSLLLAGVFPRLGKQGYRPVYVRTLQHPLDDLVAAICATCAVHGDATGLKELIGEAAKNGTVLLVLDQFEEFFIRFSDHLKLRTAFVTAVSALIRDKECDVRVLFSLREDYLAALDDFQRTFPDLFVNAYRLLPLTALGAREAIIGPLKRGGIQYDDQLVSRLVDELAPFNFDSARLQIACTELYDTAKARMARVTRLTEGDLNELNQKSYGLKGVFRRYLQAAIDDIPAKRHLLARTVLDVLITREDTKFVIARTELLGFKFAAEAEVESVLATLILRKVIRPLEKRGDDDIWYELIHECLVKEIRTWLDENKDFANFRFARDLIAYYSRDARFREQKGLLLTAKTLAEMVSPHKDRFRLNPLQAEFVLWSAISAQSEDIAHWVELFGEQNTVRLLHELLDSEDPDLRAGAAIAVRCSSQNTRDLIAKCVVLALDKTQHERVRRAAGRTIAAVSTDAEIACIKQQLQSFWRTPPSMRELLADLQEQDRVRKVFGRWRARSARRLLYKRLLMQQGVDIKVSGWFGALRGLLGALTWALTSGLVSAVLVDWICNPFPDKSIVEKGSMYLGLTVPAGIIFGAFIGWRVSRTALKIQSVLGNRLWKESIQRSRPIRWILLPVGTVIAITSLYSILDYFGGKNYPDLWIICLALVAGWFLAKAISFLIAYAAQLISDCVSGASVGRVVIWTAVPNIALSVVLPAILMTLISSLLTAHFIQSERNDALLRLFLSNVTLVFVIGGLFLFVLTAALAVFQSRTTHAHDNGALGKRNRIRGFFAIAALLIFPWFLISYGFRTIPLAPPRLRKAIPADGKLHAKLWRWPETDYFPLLSDQKGALFRATLPVTARVNINRRDLGYGSAGGEVILFVPTQRFGVAISNFNSTLRSGSVDMKMTPITLQSEQNVPYTGEVVYMRCDLRPVESERAPPTQQSNRIASSRPKMLRGELSKTFKDYKYDSSDTVEITLNRYSVLDSTSSFVVFEVSDLVAPDTKSTNEKSWPSDFILQGGEVGIFQRDSQKESSSSRSDITDLPFRTATSINRKGEWAAKILLEPVQTLQNSKSVNSVSIVVGARLKDAKTRAVASQQQPPQ